MISHIKSIQREQVLILHAYRTQSQLIDAISTALSELATVVTGSSLVLDLTKPSWCAGFTDDRETTFARLALANQGDFSKITFDESKVIVPMITAWLADVEKQPLAMQFLCEIIRIHGCLLFSDVNLHSQFRRQCNLLESSLVTHAQELIYYMKFYLRNSI